MAAFPHALKRLFSSARESVVGTSGAGTALTAKGSRAGPLIAYQSLGEPVWSPRDYGAFAREGFMQNAIVYRSVRMIAEAAASIPILLYCGDEEIEAHPLLDLMRRPNPDHSGTDFLEAWYGYLLVAGNAYVEAVAVDGEIRELHNLRPDRMKVIPGADGWPEGYEYTAGGRAVRFIDDVAPGVRPVLHTRLFHPANDHYGMSPIEAAATAIDIHNTASGWNKALLDNSARPSGALVYAASNGQLTEEQFARLKGELEANYQGAQHAGRPLLLEGGLDWKPLSLSPKDMDFIEAKHAAAREIALAIGVPPMLLGIPGDNTYSNYAEAQRAFWRQTVLPLANRMAQGFGGWLLTFDVSRADPGALTEFVDAASSDRARALRRDGVSAARAVARGFQKSSRALDPQARADWGGGRGTLQFKLDLDQVEALNPEREALWARLNAASFLSENEKRIAAGYAAREAATDGSSSFLGAPSDSLFDGASDAQSLVGPSDAHNASGQAFARPSSRPEGADATRTDRAGADIDAKYSPDQPRVPAGNSDGGQWTDGGGGGGSASASDGRVLSDVQPDNFWTPGTQVAQAGPSRAQGLSRIRAQFPTATPAQETRLVFAESWARDATTRVREIDPNWRRPASVYSTAEGAIAALEAEALAAEARFRELRQGALPNTDHRWGLNRFTKELYRRGFRYEEPTDAPGKLYRDKNGAELRIMKRPRHKYRDDNGQKHSNEYYYRYRSGGDQRWGQHITIPDKFFGM